MKDKFMSTFMALFLMPFMALFSGLATATEVTLQWTLPIDNCDGTLIDQSTLGPMEIYVSENPIPASDVNCSDPPDDPPTGFIPVPVPAGTTSIVVDLDAGKTYFFRARVQGPGGDWSNFSSEATHIIPFIQVSPPTVLIIG